MLNPDQVKVELARLTAEREAKAAEYDHRMEILSKKIKENPNIARLPLPVDFNKPEPITGKYTIAATR